MGKPKHAAYRPHKRLLSVFPGPSMTRQEFAEECDINVIMRRYGKTGVISHIQQRPPSYGDFADLPNLHDAMNMFNAASEAFLALPAVVRRDFDNDPQKFVEFAQDEKNIDKLREYGLADVPKAPEPPMKVEVVSTSGDRLPPVEPPIAAAAAPAPARP